MGKKDKKHKKSKPASTSEPGLLERLQEENAELRSRLKRISDLARPPVPLESDEEDSEYEELSHDVDDEIAVDQNK